MAASAVQATISRLDSILKDRPLTDAVQEALNKATPFAEEITQELTLSGRKGIFPVQFGVNESVFMRGDAGTFGDVSTNQPQLAEVYAKYMYALFEITGPLMSATRDNPGAFEDGLALSIENTVDGLKLDAARQYIGDGSGIIAICDSGTHNATQVTGRNPFGIITKGDSPTSFTGVGSTNYKADKVVKNILRTDARIDVYDDTDGTTKLGDNALITAVTPGTSTTVYTIGSNYDTWTHATMAEHDIICRAGNYNKEIQGFLAACSTSTSYLNITRSGLTGWNGTLVDITNAGSTALPLEPDDLRDIVDQIEEDSGQVPTFMVGNYKQRRNVYNLTAPQIRFGPMDARQGLQKGEIGHDSTISFDGMRFIAERYWPQEHIGFVNTRFWYHAIDKEVEWIEGTNGTVLHFLLTSDTYRAVMRTFRNMVCLYPAAQGLLYGISES